MRALAVGAITAAMAAGTLVGVGYAVLPEKGKPRRHMDTANVLRIEEGLACRTNLNPEFDLSCATAAFGDMRFNCTEIKWGRCPETASVTVRNTGRAAVQVTVISGSRPGERRITSALILRVGASVELRPRPGDRYLYDASLRQLRPGVAEIRIIDVQ